MYYNSIISKNLSFTLLQISTVTLPNGYQPENNTSMSYLPKKEEKQIIGFKKQKKRKNYVFRFGRYAINYTKGKFCFFPSPVNFGFWGMAQFSKPKTINLFLSWHIKIKWLCESFSTNWISRRIKKFPNKFQNHNSTTLSSENAHYLTLTSLLKRSISTKTGHSIRDNYN